MAAALRSRGAGAAGVLGSAGSAGLSNASAPEPAGWVPAVVEAPSAGLAWAARGATVVVGPDALGLGTEARGSGTAALGSPGAARVLAVGLGTAAAPKLSSSEVGGLVAPSPGAVVADCSGTVATLGATRGNDGGTANTLPAIGERPVRMTSTTPVATDAGEGVPAAARGGDATPTGLARGALAAMLGTGGLPVAGTWVWVWVWVSMESSALEAR